MSAADSVRGTAKKIEQSVTFKLVVIGLLILVLLIPVSMVTSLIHEREYRMHSVVDEISEKWGREQIITGPVISIPYLTYFEDEKGKKTAVTQYLHFLPDTVEIESRISPRIRYRGIYEAVLYNTELTIDGSFPGVPLEDLRIRPEDMVWSGALISIGISDMRGIKEQITATFDGRELGIKPGVETADVIASGVSARIPLDSANGARPFHFTLNLNGSRRIDFSPVGKVTTVRARSSWVDPSFCGAFLPVERAMDAKGFQATWKVLDLNRNFPQSWKGRGPDLSTAGFGVHPDPQNRLVPPASGGAVTANFSGWALSRSGFLAGEPGHRSAFPWPGWNESEMFPCTFQSVPACREYHNR